MYTIMHIADLHRSPSAPVSNAELIGSLKRDAARYTRENPPIPAPSAIVLTGDIVQGLPLGEQTTPQLLEEQYELAYSFLAQLADQFLEGDRSQVVLLPGNHDIDWNVALDSMEQVPQSEWPEDILAELTRTGSRLRWSWQHTTLYRIKDYARYQARFTPFNNLLDRFHDGVTLPHKGTGQSYVTFFELCDSRILLAAFNSCHTNDCFSLAGSIPPEAIEESYNLISHPSSLYELPIAAWHHNTSGPPSATDYMDFDYVRRMIPVGFRLALHGHQHSSTVEPHQVVLGSAESIAVVGTGALCASPPDFPVGVNRQYNLIELSDDLLSARVHIREVETGVDFAPRRLDRFGGRSYTELNWLPPAGPVGVSLDRSKARIDALVLQAEKALKAEDYDTACDLLAPHVSYLPTHGRRLLAQAQRDSARFADTVRDFSPPSTIEELVDVISALEKLGQPERALQTLDQYAPSTLLPESISTAIRERLRAGKKLRQQ
jgi:hypothetical protein